MRRVTRAIAIAAVAAALPAFAQDWRILPSNPVAGEQFVIQHTASWPSSPVNVLSSNVDIQGSTLTYTFEVRSGDFSAVSAYRTSSVVQGLPAGNYNIVLARVGESPITSTVGSIQVAASSGPAQPFDRNLSGNWFAPDESGWGINIVQGASGALFGVWLTYWAPPGVSPVTTEPMWLVMPAGRWLSPTEFRGPLYRTTGSPLYQPFVAATLSVMPVGHASLRFTSSHDAVFRAEVGIATAALAVKEKTVRRFDF